MSLPPFIVAMAELEAFAKESGWEWSRMGHAELIRKLIEEVKETRSLFDLQWTRMREATKAWQAAHPGNDNVWPDLGDLLTWLLEQRQTKLSREMQEDQ